ncbi:MAG: hypothetical protein JW940_39160 [Polyangiaceae bacterium]|nr:hypothetical protein [Polyangiaceae bacterium]
MSNLSFEAQELVRAVKDAHCPSETDRARLLEAMRARLGDAVVLGEGTVGASMAARGSWSSSATGLSMVGLAVVAGGALWYALRSEPGQPTAAPRTATSAAAPAVVIPSPAPAASAPPEPAREDVAPPARQPGPVRSAPVRRPRDGLSEEVAILSRAETELHGGRLQSALKSLDEHERKFGRGLLTEERTAARIQILCALGRSAEAQAELARLVRIAPRSPHTERARQACRQRPAP